MFYQRIEEMIFNPNTEMDAYVKFRDRLIDSDVDFKESISTTCIVITISTPLTETVL